MATEIKRVRFFDGQFLKQLEFREEQAYHVHLRRRMNFFLFGQSGVVSIGADDLKFFDFDHVNRTFRVRAGMAICRSPLVQEGKEIVLFQDSPPFDLDNAGVSAGGTAYVTLHWAEEEAKDPPSEGDVDESTRVREKAVLTVHPSLPVGPAPGGEELILLGTITNTNPMVADHSTRHEAKLRASLVSAAVLPAPAITSLTGTTSAAPGAPAVAAVVHGTNLAGATAVTFSDPAVTAIIGPGGTASAVNISVTVGAAAGAGPKSFTVTAPGGVATSPAGVSFTVTGPLSLPTIGSLSVNSGVQGSVVNAVITGTNLQSATAISFSGAGVSAVINPGGTATTVNIAITISAAAAAGPRTFTVTTPGGVASSAGVPGAAFTVAVAAPPVALLNLQPSFQASGFSVDVHGNNIRNPALSAGVAAAGTTVQLAKGGSTKAALNITVRPDVAGHQVVRVTIPDRTGTSWAKNEAVTLTLTFSSSSSSLPFTYDDP